MLTRTVVDGVELLRIEHGKANALDLELLNELSAAFDEAAEVRGGLVLTGSGSIFCAGVDLFRVVDGGRPYIERFLPALSRVFLQLFTLSRPVVAAINGHAIAGGCILACACDCRVMGQDRGRIGLPELAVGVPFPASAVELLRSITGSARLQELLYFGRTYEPHDALKHGLVDEVVPSASVLERAIVIARELAARPGDSFRITKNYVRGPAAARIRAAEEDAANLLDAWASPETLASVRAYLEKTLRK